MILRSLLILSVLLGPSCHSVLAESPKTQQRSNKSTARRVPVPEQVAAEVRPMLDLRQRSIEQCGEPGTPSRCIQGEAYEHEQQRQEQFAKLLAKLTQRKESAVDEALVVLMCFYVGESQEGTDAIVARGPRMLTYLSKYRHGRPSIPQRVYPKSMFKDPSVKADDFTGTIKAIRKK